MSITMTIVLVISVVIFVSAMIALILAVTRKCRSVDSVDGYAASFDWDAYCGDMFPGNDAFNRAARESCANSAQATYNLLNGVYNR